MSVLPRWVLVWALLLAGGLRLRAASAEETAFNTASREFLGNSFERADVAFGEFVQTYTNSSRRAEALLYQAEARLKLGRPAAALGLLVTNLPLAGKRTESYLFYLGKAYAQSGDYRNARDTFGRLLQEFQASTNGLRAVVEQATACKELGDWPQVIQLLQQTNGVFQSAVRTRPADDFAQRGWLLLGEAWLRQSNAPQRFAAAEAALQPLSSLALKADIDWQRQELLCRILLGSGRTNEALQNTTNLLAVATQAGAREWLARSYEFRAGLLEGLGRLDEAIAAYTNNLVDGVPDELRRWALLQSTKLFLAQQKTANAIQTLEKFVAQYSNAPAADVALLTLGELHLGQLLAGANASSPDLLAANAPDPTNAIARLQAVVQRFPQSAFAAKAQLDLGWCFWLWSRLPALQTNPPALKAALQTAETNFQAAATNPLTTDPATAYFKLAEAQFCQGQLAETQFRQGLQKDATEAARWYRLARTNYSLLRDKFAALPEVRTNLLEPALYQVVQAGLAAGDLTEATNAMALLLERFPEGFHTAPAVLLAGQALGQQGDPRAARAILLRLAARATNAPLPLVQLALARTWEEEGNWTNATYHYSQALSHCTNEEWRAQAEFYRAQATWRAGDLSNALILHTNFVAHFPDHTNAPIAQFWVGDYYFTLGGNFGAAENFRAAELSYQRLFESTNWRGSELVDLARMMAGRAAFQQHLWNNAVNDFTNITGNSSSPLWVEAAFAYGDCELSQLTKDRGDTNNTRHLDKAISIFSSICEKFPTGPQVPIALGKKAGALVQMAQYTGDIIHYTNALSTYQQITNSAVDVTVRSLAKVGMAVALKWQAEQKSGAEQAALFRQALEQCKDVVRGTILGRDEKGDPFWTLHAGETGIGLAENLQDWPDAISLCKELAQLFPSLSARYQEKVKTLETRQSNLTRN